MSDSGENSDALRKYFDKLADQNLQRPVRAAGRTTVAAVTKVTSVSLGNAPSLYDHRLQSTVSNCCGRAVRA